MIPVSLKLPQYMGGVTGQATLLANNADGLELTSLHIGVDDLDLGALEIKDLSIRLHPQRQHVERRRRR